MALAFFNANALIPKLFKTKQTLSQGTSKMETVPL